MEQGELEQLDALLNKLRQDKDIMQDLSILEQGQLTGASETICSLIREHLKPPARGPQTGTE